MKNIAIIPARSGSKGLLDKNILSLAGKPLLAHTIEAANKSNIFDYVMVSTDSEYYAEIAKKYGAEVPFLRDAKTSTDTASSWDVTREVLEKLKEEGKTYDLVTLLQPTSPLRDAKDIQRAIEQFVKKEAKTVISVCEVDHPMEWSFLLDESESMKEYVISPARNMRRQEIPQRYIENGAIYITEVKELLMHGDIYRDKCFAHVMEKAHSFDIDDEFDFKIVEILWEQK